MIASAPDTQIQGGGVRTLLTDQQHHQCPDCLSIELAATPVQPSSTEPEQIHLYLTINFNQQWESLLDGRVKFGLKGGVLRLKLDNSEFSLATSELKTAQFQLTPSPVSIKDSATNSVWAFEIKIGDSVLQGSLKNAKLGTVNVKAKPSLIEALFEVSKQDVHLTDAEGLWRHDISPNKHAVLERKLALFLLETKLTPYVSWVKLSYEQLPASSPPVAPPSRAIAPQALQDLGNLIQRLSAVETNNFLELAKIANLNPLIDFAGSSLCGTSLNGLDLNGANFSHTNLRGADFSDADLGDAKLSGAKLSGADFSGAYLANADLIQANLHRASLALANLSGANLSGANLSEANLSSANLSSAIVQKAQFGRNLGISEEAKLNLKQRGAIFGES